MGSVLSWNKPAELPAAAPSSLANDGALPTDMLYEILLRLPASELCRLRLVCRSWRSLTSNPGFAKAHASRHPLVVCIYDDDEDSNICSEVRILDLSGNIIKRVPLQHWGDQLSTQHYLVCVTTFLAPIPCYILNITAHEATTTLPDSTRGHKTCTSVLGYVPSTREYKVLRTHTYGTRDHIDDEQTSEVMTLSAAGSGRWRERSSCPPVFVSTEPGQIVVINGVAYFLPMNRYYIDYNPTKVKPDTIALFDMMTEEWRKETIQGPATGKKLMYNVHHNNLELAILDSCLVMVQHFFQDCSIDLWFLEDVDKGLWTRRYSTQYAPSHLHNYNCNMYLSLPYPLVLLEDGKIVMWFAGEVVLRVYDPTRRTWADLTKLEHCFGTNMYTGNLLSVYQVCS